MSHEINAVCTKFISNSKPAPIESGKSSIEGGNHLAKDCSYDSQGKPPAWIKPGIKRPEWSRGLSSISPKYREGLLREIKDLVGPNQALEVFEKFDEIRGERPMEEMIQAYHLVQRAPQYRYQVPIETERHIDNGLERTLELDPIETMKWADGVRKPDESLVYVLQSFLDLRAAEHDDTTWTKESLEKQIKDAEQDFLFLNDFVNEGNRGKLTADFIRILERPYVTKKNSMTARELFEKTYGH